MHARHLALFAALAPFLASACQLLVGLDAALVPPDAGLVPSDAAVVSPDATGAPDATDRDYAAEVLADAPLVYLRVDEASGSSVADATGRPTVATLSGSYRRGRPSLVRGPGASIGLGEGARITLPATLDVATGSDMTWELWVRPASSEPTGNLVANDATMGAERDGTVLFLDFPPNGRNVTAGFERWASGLLGAAHFEGRRPSALPGNVFHVVASVRSGTPRLVMNGELAEGFLKLSPSAYRAGLRPVVVGDLDAEYDEIAFYPRALSDDRARAHFEAGRPR